MLITEFQVNSWLCLFSGTHFVKCEQSKPKFQLATLVQCSISEILNSKLLNFVDFKPKINWPLWSTDPSRK